MVGARDQGHATACRDIWNHVPIISGTSNTSLIDNASAPLFSFTGLTFGQTAKVELLSMSASGAAASSISGAIGFSGTCSASGCANIRVDNINFGTSTWSSASSSGAVILVDNVFGVIDHNSDSEPASGAYFLTDVSFSAWQGVGAFGDNSFASADTFGTAQTIFMENNDVSGIRLSENDVPPPGGAVGGARRRARSRRLALA